MVSAGSSLEYDDIHMESIVINGVILFCLKFIVFRLAYLCFFQLKREALILLLWLLPVTKPMVLLICLKLMYLSFNQETMVNPSVEAVCKPIICGHKRVAGVFRTQVTARTLSLSILSVRRVFNA